MNEMNTMHSEKGIFELLRLTKIFFSLLQIDFIRLMNKDKPDKPEEIMCDCEDKFKNFESTTGETICDK